MNTGVRTDTHSNQTHTFDDALWARIASLTFDPPGTHLSFATRLARETGWSAQQTTQAIQEYRRFLYLAVRAGHPVTPSQAVDEVWHLHLMYTRHYWDVLCGTVLCQPLHHGPSLGGPDETAKFRDWYQRTLDSYQNVFGEAPPSDIWPAPERRFDRPKTRPVDTSRHWIIPKPALPNWARRLLPGGLLALLLTLPPLSDAFARAQTDLPVPPTLIVFLTFLGMVAVFNFTRWLLETPEERQERLERARENRNSGGCGTSGGCGSSCGSGGCGGGCG